MAVAGEAAATGSAWLAGIGLPTRVGFLARLVRLVMLSENLFASIAEPHGLSFDDYLVLATTRRSPGASTSPSQLCRVLGRTTGGMTLTLDRLAHSGWLRRSPDPVDRRRVVVQLTPEGRRLCDQVNRALHDWERKAVPLEEADGLSEELDHLLAVVGRG